jgi:hypothetical protein
MHLHEGQRTTALLLGLAGLSGALVTPFLPVGAPLFPDFWLRLLHGAVRLEEALYFLLFSAVAGAVSVAYIGLPAVFLLHGIGARRRHARLRRKGQPAKTVFSHRD